MIILAKPKITQKIETKHTFAIEGALDISNLGLGAITCDVEEEGEVDLLNLIKKFNGETVRLSIVKKEVDEEEF